MLAFHIMIRTLIVIWISLTLHYLGRTASFRPLRYNTNQFHGAFAYSQTADGSVVVGNVYVSGKGRTAIWRGENPVGELGTLGGTIENHQARAISRDGQRIAGTSSSPSGSEAFLWTQETGMIGLGSLSSVFQSEGRGLSSDGRVVIGYSFRRGYEPFRWTAASGMEGLGDLPGGSILGDALGVNADGSVVVGYASSSKGQEAYRWSAETGMVGLGGLPGGSFRSTATAVSADGQTVVGWSSTDSTQAFVWTASEGMIGLTQRPSEGTSKPTSEAHCISPDGTVIGGEAQPGGAALWINRGAPLRVQDLLLAEGIDVIAQGWTALFRIRSIERRNGRLSLVGEGFLGGPWWVNGTHTPFLAEIADPTAPVESLRLTLRTTGSEVVIRVEPGGSGTLTLERSSNGNSWTTFHTRVLSSPDAFELNLGPATSGPALFRAIRTP
jgi:probable HAF family extracellular repeat protein